MSDIAIYNYSLLGLNKCIPLGQFYLVSVLRENGYSVDFKDFQFLSSPKKEELLSFFEESSDIIGIGCTSHLLPSLLLLINELKKRYPEKTVILGGPGPTGVAEEILKTAPVDIVVRGEGEKTIVELMDCLEKNKDLKNVRGISYRDGNKIRTNPPQSRIEDLDQIPFPAYDKIDINKYVMPIMTSRGCPYKCGFCYHELWGDKVRFRGVDNVIEEIKLLYEKYGVKSLSIYDDTFVLNEKRVFDFCDKLRKEKIDIKWGCFGRVNLMNDKIMKEMSKSGCVGVFYGIESGSDKILKKINKGFSAKMAEDIVKKSKKYFHKIRTSFIWGFPFETIGDLKKTVKLAEKFVFKFNAVSSVNPLVPEIGTQIYNEYYEYLMPSFFNLPEILLNSGDIATLTRTLNILHKDENIFELFKNHPSITVEYHRYKTPNFSQKLKIMERFLEKKNLYFRIKNL